MEHGKPDLTLADGREINFNFDAITIREFRSLFDVNQPDDEEYAIFGKLIGMSADEVADLSYAEWKKLIKAIPQKARELSENPT